VGAESGQGVAPLGLLVAPEDPGDPSAQDAFFDELAEPFARRYESHPSFRERMAVFTREARSLRDRIGPETHSRCLDLGCGPGVIAAGVAELGFEVLGIDRSERMIRAARQLAARRAVTRGKLRLVHGELVDFLSSSPETFSLILSSSVLEYLTDPLEAVRLAACRLEPGGTLAFSIPNFASILRVVEPWIDRLRSARPRCRTLWGNQLRPADYLRVAWESGLRFEGRKTFGLPNLPLRSCQTLLRNRWFQTMSLLVFRRPRADERALTPSETARPGSRSSWRATTVLQASRTLDRDWRGDPPALRRRRTPRARGRGPRSGARR